MRTASVPLRQPLFRGERRLRIALVGLPGAGAATIFRGIESTAQGCDIDVGLDQVRVTRNDPALADVVVQVLDATDLERHLGYTLGLMRLGKPLVLAVNKMDAARDRNLHIGTKALARRIGLAVVPTIGAMGYGVSELFAAAVHAARRTPPAAPAEPGDGLAGILAEAACRPGGVRERQDWRYWADELFLSPRWGLVGSALVFAAALFVVFGVSAWIDALTTAPLAEQVSAWQPEDVGGLVLRAVADGLVGLLGILVPYMIPLLVLLVLLEQAGVMARVGFALDRFFHRIGLHGDVALPLLVGLGCNVPALSAMGAIPRARERTIGSLLVTFVPCSARSAIILAVGGKYLGAWGVLAVFAVAALVVALLGAMLRRRLPESTGYIQEIPAYALPRLAPLLRETWLRSKEILTIVTPLLVGGSVVLALLGYVGGDRIVNALLSPLTNGWLGLPVALGVPLLFGVLRKELSLLMVYQALGGFDIAAFLGSAQIFTFLVFLTLYVPCLSTFAVLVKTVGRRQALFSVLLSVGTALAAAGAARFVLQGYGA